MKKRISVLLTLTTLLTVMAVFALPASALTTSGTCGAEGEGSNLTWTVDIDTGVLEIKGKGAMEDYYLSEAPWDNLRNSIKTLVLSEGVSSIGNYAFFWCTELASAEIPDGITTIGENAFYQCKNLTSVTLPDGVTAIGANVFSYCEKLSSITIPDSVISIGANMCAETNYYKDKANWTDGALYIDRHLIEVNTESVSGTYTIREGTLTIAQQAMRECDNLIEVIIPDSVVSIGAKAFVGCRSLTDVVIPDSVKLIDDGAFEMCRNLTSVVIGNGVTEIGESAFDKVKKLEKVYIKSPAIANQLTSSQACGDLLKYTPSVMIADEIGSVPEFIIENYPYTTSETYDGVAYTVYTKIAPPPETTPDEGGEGTTAPEVTEKPATDAPVVTNKPATDAPTTGTPSTDAPATDAPVTATPPSTTTKTPTVSSTDSEVNPPADSDGGDSGTMLTVIAVLLVCLIGAVTTLTVVVLKKK